MDARTRVISAQQPSLVASLWNAFRRARITNARPSAGQLAAAWIAAALAGVPQGAMAQFASTIQYSEYMRPAAIHGAFEMMDGQSDEDVDRLVATVVTRSRASTESHARSAMKAANARVAVIVNEYLRPDDLGLGAKFPSAVVGVGPNTEWAVRDAVSTVSGGKVISRPRSVHMLRANYGVSIHVIHDWGYEEDLGKWEAEKIMREVEASLHGGPSLPPPAGVPATIVKGTLSLSGYNPTWSAYLDQTCSIVSLDTGSVLRSGTSAGHAPSAHQAVFSRPSSPARDHEGPRGGSGRDIFGGRSAGGFSGNDSAAGSMGGTGNGTGRGGPNTAGERGTMEGGLQFREISTGRTKEIGGFEPMEIGRSGGNEGNANGGGDNGGDGDASDGGDDDK